MQENLNISDMCNGRTELGDEEGGTLPSRAVPITDAEVSGDVMAAARRLGGAATPSEAQLQSGLTDGDDALIMPPEAKSQPGPVDGVDALTVPPEPQSQGPTDRVDALSSLLAEAAPYLQS